MKQKSDETESSRKLVILEKKSLIGMYLHRTFAQCSEVLNKTVRLQKQ